MRRKLYHLAVTLCELREQFMEGSGQTEAYAHFQKASRECLLGFRAMVDTLLDDLDQKSNGSSEVHKGKGKKITIDD